MGGLDRVGDRRGDNLGQWTDVGDVVGDVIADACVRDESGKLMFLSLYGRDTAIQQLLAAFTLKETNGGISEFRLSTVTDDGVQTIERVEVGDPDRLTKFNGRLPKENLFGNLVHTWIYDEVLLKPDRSNKTAWLMLDEPFTTSSRPRLIQGIWSLYKTLSPVPLLDGWSEVVLRATQGECVSFHGKQRLSSAWQCQCGSGVIAGVFCRRHFQNDSGPHDGPGKGGSGLSGTSAYRQHFGGVTASSI